MAMEVGTWSETCYLARDLYVENLTESHPFWSRLEPEDYVIEFRKFKCRSRRQSCCHGERLGDVHLVNEVPDFTGCKIPRESLKSPVEYVAEFVQYLGMNLEHSEVEEIASFVAELKNLTGIGTRVVVVAEIHLCRIECVPGCVLDDLSELLSDTEDTESKVTANALAIEGYDGVGDDTCSICLNEFSGSQEILRTTCCSHNFHLKCLGTWMKSKTNCPMCRTQINAEQGGVAYVDLLIYENNSFVSSNQDVE